MPKNTSVSYYHLIYQTMSEVLIHIHTHLNNLDYLQVKTTFTDNQDWINTDFVYMKTMFHTHILVWFEIF
jgi:hypothetical protein